MRNSEQTLVAGAIGLLLLLTVNVVGQEIQQGDHIDVTISDGRVFKNAEVLRADEESVLIKHGNLLTTFKRRDVHTISLAGTASPSAPPAPKQAEPAPVVVAQPAVPSAAPVQVATQTTTTQVPVIQPQVRSTPLAALGIGALVVLAYALWQTRTNRKLRTETKRLDVFSNDLKTKLAGLEIKYSSIIELDKVKDERKQEIQTIAVDLRQRVIERDQVKSEIAALREELSTFEEEQNIVACGHYRPTFDFNTSEEFKQAIDKVRDVQRDFLKNDQAAHCSETWTVNGSEVEGKKATKRTLRLMLRAFNGESDALIARVSWNNIDRMLERLEAVFEAVNKLGESYKCSLTHDYMMLKQRELKLTFEYENKLKKEKDEQRELKEQMRDEERARREMEEALRQTAADEERAKKALEQARAELAVSSGEKEASLNEKIQLLESRLQEALRNKERALSRAQQTRSGHVYIISNIGSFGETVFKIGMTRRLDPLDRVHELGDASVPFAFDVHAMIYTDDAPTMESKLHQRFDRHRVNLVNERKEFFHATIVELEAAVRELGATIELTKLAEAREYRETLERKKTTVALMATVGTSAHSTNFVKQPQ